MSALPVVGHHSSARAHGEPDEPDRSVDEPAPDIRSSEPPTAWDAALHSGPVAVVDGCLQIGDAVVVWDADHLGVVEEILARTAGGEALTVTVGGGGRSVTDGDPLADLPAAITDRCAPSAIWGASPHAPTVG